MKSNIKIFFIILLGTLLASYLLTARSLWFDEAFSWRLIQFSWGEMIARDIQDVHPPLYYIFLKFWSIIFGTTLLSLRSFSVFFFGVSIWLCYIFAKEVSKSSRTALLAAFLLAISGWHIQFAWEARMYTVGVALSILSSWLLLKSTRSNNLSYWVLYAFAASAFAYIHYFAFFTIAAHAVFVLWVLWKDTRGRLGEVFGSRKFWYAVSAATLAIVTYIPWLPHFLAQNSQVQDNFWIPRIGGWSIPDTFYRMLAPTPSIPCHIGIPCIVIAALPIAIILLVITSLIFRRVIPDLLPMARISGIQSSQVFIFFLSLVPFILTILISLIPDSQSLYQDRYFVFNFPFIITAIAIFIASFKPRPRRLLAGLSIIFLFFTFYQHHLELDIKSKPGAHAAAREVFRSDQSQIPVIVTSPFVYFAIEHYAIEEFSKDSSQVSLLSTDIQHFSGGPILMDEDFVGEEIFNNQTSLWLVDTNGFGESIIEIPTGWQVISESVYPEVFPHQKEVFVRLIQKN